MHPIAKNIYLQKNNKYLQYVYPNFKAVFLIVQ